MRRLVGSIGVVFAVTIMIVSALINARYGMSLARDGFDKNVMIAVALFADGGKALSWIYCATAFARREWIACIVSGLVFCVCLTYAVAGALGFVAMNRAQSSATVENQSEIAKALDAEIERKDILLKAYGIVEPAAAIAKRLEALQQDRRYTTSKKCADATLEHTRNFCASYQRLEANGKTSEAAEKLENELAHLRNDRRKIGGVASVGGGDFQGSLIAQITNLKLSTVQLSLSILVVALVEFGASFFLWASLNYLAAGRKSTAKSANGTTQSLTGSSFELERRALVDFVKENIELVDGARTERASIVTTFKVWLRRRGLEVWSDELISAGLDQFCRAGGLEEKRSGRKKFIVGVKLRKIS